MSLEIALINIYQHQVTKGNLLRFVHSHHILCACIHSSVGFRLSVYVYALGRVCFIFQNYNSSLSSLGYTPIKPKSNLRYLRHQGLLHIQSLSYCTSYTKLFKRFILRLA